MPGRYSDDRKRRGGKKAQYSQKDWRELAEDDIFERRDYDCVKIYASSVSAAVQQINR